MPTLDDLLNSFGLNDEGEEKIASEHSDANEQAMLEELLHGEEKTAGENDMSSLADLYLQISGQDDVPAEDDMLNKLAELAMADEGEEEKVAAEKLAAEYDAAGRIMARGFFDEFNKLAMGELEGPSQAKTPALGDRGTEYQMETNVEPTGPIDMSGGDQQHAQILKGKAEGPAGRAEGAMGPQFATAKHLVTARASQAGAK